MIASLTLSLERGDDYCSATDQHNKNNTVILGEKKSLSQNNLASIPHCFYYYLRIVLAATDDDVVRDVQVEY